MLLGADGLPMKKAGDASSTAAPSAEDKKAAALAMDAAADAIKGSSGGLSSIDMPEDLYLPSMGKICTKLHMKFFIKLL